MYLSCIYITRYKHFLLNSHIKLHLNLLPINDLRRDDKFT